MEENPQEPIYNKDNLAIDETRHLDATLRPAHFDDYIGQEIIKQNIHILLTASKQRGTPPEHILLHGPPGLGKTTLAHLIAKEMNTNLRITSGPAITKVGDLAAILTNLQPYDILFIDEIHRLSKTIEEVLYPAMESGKIDIIIGKGTSARTIQLDLPPFTLVAATTELNNIAAPLLSRFAGGSYRLQWYTLDELVTIIIKSGNVLGIEIKNDAALKLARRSRFTPRYANYYLKRARDYAQVHELPISEEVVDKALSLLEVDDNGFGVSERMILNALVNTFNGQPVGLTTLSAATGENAQTIEGVIEPYLIQMGMIVKTSRGRIATEKAAQALKDYAPYTRD